MARKQPTERVNVARRWTVTGIYAFPLDMLRYDSAWPASEEDSNEISRSLDPELCEDNTTVNVKMRGEPTLGRWQSFGWKVIGYYDNSGIFVRIAE